MLIVTMRNNFGSDLSNCTKKKKKFQQFQPNSGFTFVKGKKNFVITILNLQIVKKTKFNIVFSNFYEIKFRFVLRIRSNRALCLVVLCLDALFIKTVWYGQSTDVRWVFSGARED